MSRRTGRSVLRLLEEMVWPELLNWTALHSSEVVEDSEVADLKVSRVITDVWVIRWDPGLRLTSVYTNTSSKVNDTILMKNKT